MTPTEELMNEHRAILSALDVTEAICRQIDEGKPCPADDVARILEFLKTFADRCHHAKEENLLFPALEEAGVPKERGPIGVMLSEHALGRKYISLMSEALEGVRSHSVSAPGALASNARAYINLLRAHIMKENEVLFPLAERRLSAVVQENLSSAFARYEEEEIGRSEHERFHSMLRELHDEYLA